MIAYLSSSLFNIIIISSISIFHTCDIFCNSFCLSHYPVLSFLLTYPYYLELFNNLRVSDLFLFPYLVLRNIFSSNYICHRICVCAFINIYHQCVRHPKLLIYGIIKLQNDAELIIFVPKPL